MPMSQNQTLYLGVAITASILVAGYIWSTRNSQLQGTDSGKKASSGSDGKDKRAESPPRVPKKDFSETTTPLVSNTTGRGLDVTPQKDKDVHLQIEELDRQGKKLFKDKKVRASQLICIVQSCVCVRLFL
jgi:hypothetical protein